MSISINKNEIIHMDDYFRDRKRETFKPLIQNMAEDMLENGFKDVGPNITKITINDTELTNFIDEFIVFYYDSAHGTSGSGANGIGKQADADASPAVVANANQSFTTFFLDAVGGVNSEGKVNLGTRLKEIDNMYLNLDWSDYLAKEFANIGTDHSTTPAVGIFGVDGVDMGNHLGPNCELFSYLNPHPMLRGSRKSHRDQAALYEADLAANGGAGVLTTSGAFPTNLTDYHGIEIGSAWHDISGTDGAFPGGTWDGGAAVSGAEIDRGGAGSPIRPVDLMDGSFYKKLPKTVDIVALDDGAATPVKLEQTGYIGLPEIARAVYQNEFNKIKNLVTNNARGVMMMPQSSTGINTKAKIRMYKETENSLGPNAHDFWITNYSDENFFPPGTTEPKKYVGELLIGFDPEFNLNKFQTGDIYTFTFTHEEFGANSKNFTIDVTVKSPTLQGFTDQVYDALVTSILCDPVSGFYDVINGSTKTPARSGTILFESKKIGHNLNVEITRAQRSTETFDNDLQAFIVTEANIPFTSSMFNGTAGTATTSLSTYQNGYVNEIQIRGFDGANADDEFEFTLTGLIDELPNGGIIIDAGTGRPQVKNEIIYFKTNAALNPSQLTAGVANAIRANAYANKYLEIIAHSNSITIRYNLFSSGFMRKSDVGKSHGLLGFSSATYVTDPITTIGTTRSVEFPANGFAVADLPAEAVFSCAGTAASSDDGANIDMKNQAGNSSYTEAVLYSNAQFNDSRNFTDSAVPSNAASPASVVGAALTPTVSVPTTNPIGDPFNYGTNAIIPGDLEHVQAGLGTSISAVRLSFPLSRDLGTFANPVNGNYLAFAGPERLLRKTNYSVSYANTVIHSTVRTNIDPSMSFDFQQIADHPNTEYSGSSFSQVGWEQFKEYQHEVFIDAFEYITDYSMGPIVLETERQHSLSGYPTGIVGDTEGDQPWRIRLNVSRGKEILEASPFISEAVLQVKSDSDASSAFEYLQVHIATEFQLKGDGELVQPEGRDGIKQAVMREPGHLGALRPQYSGYIQTAAHQISPFVNREQLDASVISGFNSYGGIVGSRHFDDKWEILDGIDMVDLNFVSGSEKYEKIGAFPRNPYPIPSTPAFTKVSDVTENPDSYFGTTNANSLSPKVIQGLSSTRYPLDQGILFNDEYRFEERFLKGTSTELVHDTPYNNGLLRLQKGFFRRTGKSHPDIAPAYPMSYHLTIADHGVAFYLKDQASTAQSDDNAFFVVQRHVHSAPEIGTGTSSDPQFKAGYVDSGVDGSDHQPVHCLYATSEPALLYSDLQPYFLDKIAERQNSLANLGLFDSEGNQIQNFSVDEVKLGEIDAMDLSTQGRFRRFIVREKDTLKPWDRHVFAGINERDSAAIINPLEQLSLNDRGKLVIQFPNRLTSQRFMYTGKELDLIGFCAAGAVGQDTLISSDRMSVGDEGGTGTVGDERRLYRGMMSTGEYGSGMRILLLVGMNKEGDSVMTTPADTRLLDN